MIRTTLTGSPISGIYLGGVRQYRYTTRAAMLGFFSLEALEQLPYDVTQVPESGLKLGLQEINVLNYDGMLYYEWLYEGVSSEFFDGSSPVLDMRGTTNVEPITFHPRINEFIAKYSKGFSGGAIQWLTNISGKGAISGFTQSGELSTTINPLYGVDSYLAPGGIYSYEVPYASKALVPPDLLAGLGYIATTLPDSTGQLPAGAFTQNRNFLFGGVDLLQVGSSFLARRHYLLSGVGGWEPALYTAPAS